MTTNDKWLADQVDTCMAVSKLRNKYPSSAADVEINAAKIADALEQFQECVRYLNTRRSSGAVLNLNSEADVQDAVYLILRPWVTDLVWENPTGKVANRYTIKDFVTREAKTVIEAKYVRNENHGRQISREMHDDIENYRHHQHCNNLIFFVYDPNSFIPDLERLREQIEEERTYGGSNRVLKCMLIVKP